MKKLYKLMALLLVAAMLLCAVACGSDEKKPSIVGKWKTQIDFGDYLAKSMDVEVDANGKFEIVYFMELNEDGSCKMYIDKDTTEKNFEVFKPELIDIFVEGMYNYLETQGLTRADADEVMEAEYGVDLVGFVEQTVEENFDLNGLFDMMKDKNGFYKVEDNKLTIVEEKDDFDDTSYLDFTLDGDTLSLNSKTNAYGKAVDFGDELFGDFPIVFTR